MTASDENIAGIGRFIAEELGDVVSRWELCAFNNLATDKYRRLGRPWAFADVPLLARDELVALGAAACRSGVDPEIVTVTGPVRVDCDGTGEALDARA